MRTEPGDDGAERAAFARYKQAARALATATQAFKAAQTEFQAALAAMTKTIAPMDDA